MLIIWDPGNLGVSSDPGRLLPEAGVPDLEPPPRPLAGGNLPPFLGVYIRSETFLVLISTFKVNGAISKPRQNWESELVV